MTSTENAWHGSHHYCCSDEEDSYEDNEDSYEDNVYQRPTKQPLTKHKRPMRKWRMKKPMDEAIFSWKDAVLQRFSNVRRELMRFGYYNRASYDHVMLVIEESIAKAQTKKR